MKTVAGHEDKLIVSIPPIVRIGIVRIEPRTVLVAFKIEHIRVAVRVGYV